MEIKSLNDVDLSGIELVLLDLDNTLYSYDDCHHQAMQALMNACTESFGIDLPAAKELFAASRKKVNESLYGTAVSHSRLFYLQDMSEQLLGRTDGALTLKLSGLYWDTFISKMIPFPATIPFLENCQKKNIVTVLVTDMTAGIQFRKLQQLGIAGLLSYVVTSEEAGIEKPDPRIFELAIKKAKRKDPGIKKIALIGDDTRKDVYSPEDHEVRVFHIV